LGPVTYPSAVAPVGGSHPYAPPFAGKGFGKGKGMLFGKGFVRKVDELEVTAERWRRQREAEEDIAKELATLNTMPSSSFHMGRAWGVGRRSGGCFGDFDEQSDDEESDDDLATTDTEDYEASGPSEFETSSGEAEGDGPSGIPWYVSTPRPNRRSSKTYFDLFGLDEDDDTMGAAERIRKTGHGESLANCRGLQASLGSGSGAPAVAAPTVSGPSHSALLDDEVNRWYSPEYSLEAEGGAWYRDSRVLSRLRHNIEGWKEWDWKVQLQRLQAIAQAGIEKRTIMVKRREEEEEKSLLAEEKRLRMIEEKKKVEAEKRKVVDDKAAAAATPQSPKKLAAPAPQPPSTPDFARPEIKEKPIAVPVQPAAVEEATGETLQTAGLKALTSFTDVWGRKAELSKKYRPAWKEICIAAQQVSSTRKSITHTAAKATRVLSRNKDNEEAVRFLACASAEKLISCSINNSLDFVWTTAYHIRLVAENLRSEPAHVRELYLHALVGCLNFKCPWISWIDVGKATKAAVKHVDSTDWFKEQETFVCLWLALLLVFQDITCLWQWLAALVADAQRQDPALPMLVHCYLRVCRYDLVKRWLGPNQGGKLERLFAGPIRARIREIRSVNRSSAVVEHYGLLCETELDDPNIGPPEGVEVQADEESELNSNV
ncbi:hypothetical protein FOZ62_012199, partial [Perkinsus olseni]